MEAVSVQSLEEMLTKPGRAVWVRLPPGPAASRWTASGTEAQRGLMRAIGAVYEPQARAWNVPDAGVRFIELTFLLERLGAKVYALSRGEALPAWRA